MRDDAQLPPPVSAPEKGSARFQALTLSLLLAALALVAGIGWNLWQTRQLEAQRRQADREHRFWVVCHASYPPRDRAVAFLQLVEDGNTEWHAAQLHGLNFEGASLASLDLHEIDLTTARLVKAMLAGTVLAKARLQQTDFSEASLVRANLSGADLFRARLRLAKLVEANLRGANLQEVEAQEAVFQNADLSDAYLLMGNLSGANLTGANLTGASLEAAKLKGANLHLARLTNTILKDADFTDTNWWRARGLSTEQTALLRRKFAPGVNAAESLQADFQAWLKSPPSAP